MKRHGMTQEQAALVFQAVNEQLEDSVTENALYLHIENSVLSSDTWLDDADVLDAVACALQEYLLRNWKGE